MQTRLLADFSYEDDQTQLSVSTATVWCLHLALRTEHSRGQGFEDALAHIVSEPSWQPTGEYFRGDSWAEWGATIQPETNPQPIEHAAFYFRADDAEEALARGMSAAMYLAELLDTDPIRRAVSTAGDWAAQPPISV